MLPGNYEIKTLYRLPSYSVHSLRVLAKYEMNDHSRIISHSAYELLSKKYENNSSNTVSILITVL